MVKHAMESQEAGQTDRKPVIILAAVMGLTGLVALAFVVRGRQAKEASRTAAPRPTTRVWPSDDAPRVQDPSMLSHDAGKSSISLVERPLEAAKAGQDLSLAANPPADASAKPAQSHLEPAPAAAASAALNPAEQARLTQAAGDINDPKQAARVGGTDRLWSAALKTLSHHPKVLGFLINNDLIVGAFMGRATSRQNCQSAQSFKSYLMDLKRPGGVSHAMDVVDLVAHGDPATPGVMFGSKLADAMMSCPSVQTLKQDAGAIAAVAQANGRALQMMQDPTIMMGLGSSPKIASAYQGLQDSLGR